MRLIKRVLFWLWAAGVIVAAGAYLTFPEHFTAEKLVALLERFSTHLLAAYFLASVLRGFLLIPSTPFVLAGALLFPGHPFTVGFISMAGILVSAAFVYLWADFLDIDEILQNRFRAKFELVKAKMHQHGFWIITVWSFFPAVPTDLVCYAAGVIRFHFIKFLTAVFLGELVIVAIYVASGKALFEVLKGIFSN